MLRRWGRFVHRNHWLTLALAGTLLALTAGLMARGGHLKDSRSLNLEAGHANNLLNTQLPRVGGGSSFNLLFTSDRLRVSEPAFRDALTAAIAPLLEDGRVTSIDTPYGGDPAVSAGLASPDQSAALAVVNLRDAAATARDYYPQLRQKVRPGPLRVLAGGGVAVQRTFDDYLASDLGRAEVVAIPATVILLLLVFGALVAAGLPLLVGIVSIVGGIGGITLIGEFTDVSSYAKNVVTLIGLGVSIDYSLFIVNRYREELAAGTDREEALGTTMATAGRAIVFSGLTVAIGLSGMLFYPGSFLPSMGLAGALVVAIAVFYSLTLLPALLSLLGPRVNFGRIPITPTGSRQGWHRLAMAVMRHPVMVLVPTVGFILLAGLPFAHLRLANSDIEVLPASAEVRQEQALTREKFPDRGQTEIAVVAEFGSSPLTPDHVGAIYDLSRRLAGTPGVVGVTSIVDIDKSLGRADYQRLLGAPSTTLPSPLAKAVRQSVGQSVVVLSATTNLPPGSDAARSLVRTIRGNRAVGDGRLEVTGQTAFDLDVVDFIVQRTPTAVGFIVVVTCIVLFLLLGSVLLPIKAVVMNFLSLSASFGALVFIFQDGHLSGLLDFQPQSVDPTIPVLLFCIVFGLSMDYEVLLMSRMKEEWERSHDNRHAVAQGLELSGRLVTGAAAIMVVVFVGFGLAQVLLIKSLGIGMAIAVAIDATLVRALIVPATMRLLGELNWWAPAPIARLYRPMGLGEASSRVPEREVL